MRIEITPPNIQLAPAATLQFDAFRLELGAVNKTGGRTKITDLATWTSSDPTVATVSAAGLVTGGNPGTCRIIATSGPLRGSVVLHVGTGGFCGDGILQIANGEQCDDGGNRNLDGCSSTCKFEQNQRVNSLQTQYGATDTFCSANALGGAIVGGLAQNGLQNAINSRIQNGSISLLFVMLGINDLSGNNEAAFNMGAITGAPVAGGGYNGSSDLDWWYHPDPTAIDGSRIPTNKISTTITAHMLSTSPAHLTLPYLGANLNLSNARIKAVTNTSSTPTVSAGTPPGHLSLEHLDPALTSYASMGAGELCGGVSAQSLAITPAPSIAASCSQGYTVSNSLLDMLIGGCNFLGPQIAVTQPDTFDPNVPAAGAGAPYTLAEDSNHQVNGCKDKLNNPVSLVTCLNAAAYSSFFQFTTDRVIVK